MTAVGRFRKLKSRKNYHWQWLDACRIDDISLTRFSVPLRLKPQCLNVQTTSPLRHPLRSWRMFERSNSCLEQSSLYLGAQKTEKIVR